MNNQTQPYGVLSILDKKTNKYEKYFPRFNIQFLFFWMY